MDKKVYDAFVKILDEELIVALGCTEPIAIALASAKCREVLGVEPEKIIVSASGNIIKNVQGVIIPSTNNLKGVDLSAILGNIVGDSSKKLEILQGLKKEKILEALKLQAEGICEVKVKDTKTKLYIEIFMKNGLETALVEVMHTHTNITRIQKNGHDVFFNPCDEEDFNSSLTDRSLLYVKDIYEFAKEVKIEDIKNVLMNQIKYNIAIAKEGLNNNYGVNVGTTLLNKGDVAMKELVKAYAASGSDARMSGCDMPVVINCGSGNQGLTIAAPLYIYSENRGIGEESLLRALTIANLIPIHIKTSIGRLSALCGAISAGIGVGCGIAFLNGGSLKVIEDTIKNGIANLMGVICDGAKPSCAIKIASSVDAGYMAQQLALLGNVVGQTGIINDDVEITIKNMAIIASKAMNETDKMILDIMTK